MVVVSGDERESRTEMGFVYSVAELSVRSCVVEDSVSSGQEGPTAAAATGRRSDSVMAAGLFVRWIGEPHVSGN